MIDKREIVKEQSQTIAIGNKLIQKARYELTKTEQKVLLYMISKIKPEDDVDTEYEFSIDKFIKVCNLNESTGTYKEYIKNACLELKSHILTIPITEKKEVITSWFNDAILDYKEKKITVSFSRYLLPYLFALQKRYTSFYLEYVLPMKTDYGIRLYEYLKSVHYQGYKHIISLDELRERVGCVGLYEQSSDLRKRVIEPAIKDINGFSDLKVEYKFVKTGKKVSHIEFIILQDDFVSCGLRARALGQLDK